ncbi:MAG: AAA family ATPase, partial [Symploca sp. SIO2E6]|nr:AAA family ATPase [Symploca sp. SIO2E6]
PYLWVSDLIASLRILSPYFEVISPDTVSSDIAPGHHIIALDPEVGELNIKRLGHKLLDGGSQVDVFELQQSLSSFLFPIGDDAVPMIIMGAIRFDQWLDQIKDIPLSINEAVEQAKFYLRQCGGQRTSSINIELETLRKRCGVSSYDWRKNFIERLEAEIHAAVDGKVTDPDTRFELDLLALLQEKNRRRYLRQRSQLASRYGLTKAEIEECAIEVKRSTEVAKPKSLDLGELLDLESEGLNYLVPGLLPIGETVILAAPPKCGKTLLSIDLAFSIATGESQFLGEKSLRGKVLLVSTDESLQSTRAKLLKRGFRKRDKEYLKVLPQWDISQLGELEEILEDYRPDLVIVDSLKRISLGMEMSENSAEFADNIYTLKELFTKYSASGVLIHHTNKDREARGVHRLRGSSAIAGAVWGTWEMDYPGKGKINPKDPRRLFSAFSRDSEGTNLTIEFNPEDNSWINLGEVSDKDSVETASHKERILAVMEANSHRSGLSGREIIELLGMTKETGRSVYSALNRMVDKKLIFCAPAPGDKRYNLYSLPGYEVKKGNCHTDTPPSPTISAQVLNNLTETTVVEEKISSQQPSQELVSTSESKNDAEYLEPTPSKEYTELVSSPNTDKGGEGVSQPLVPELSHQSAVQNHSIAEDDVVTIDEELVEGSVVEPQPLRTWSLDFDTVADVLEERYRHGHMQRLIKVPAKPAKWVDIERCDDGNPRINRR